MADQDLTSLDELRPDGQIDKGLLWDDYERETRRKLKAWADVEHNLSTGKHEVIVTTTVPPTPVNNQLWFNTETNELLIYNQAKWKTVEQPTYNYLYNPGFTRYLDLVSAPIGWAAYGTSTTGSVLVSGIGLADTHQKFGPNAIGIAAGNGNKSTFQNIARNNSRFMPMVYWIGRTVTFGCWVLTTNANSAHITIDTGTGTVGDSGFHPGDGGWHWLTVTMKIPLASTYISVSLTMELINTVGYFSSPTFVEGSYNVHVLPSGGLLRSYLLHVGSTNGIIDSNSGDVWYGPQGSSLTIGQAVAILPYKCLISNLRLYVSGGAGVGQSYVGTLNTNGVDTALTTTITDTNTFNFNNINKIELNQLVTVSLRLTGSVSVIPGVVRATMLVEEIPGDLN